MPIGNRFFTAPAPSGNKSILLPDGQQFFAPKLVNVIQAAAVLTLNLSSSVTPLTYTASNVIAAYELSKLIQQAVATSGADTTVLTEPALSGGITLISCTPGSVGNLAASTIQPVVIIGTEFLTMATPDFIFLVVFDQSTGLPIDAFTSCVTVDNVTIMANSASLAAGTYTLALYDNVALRASIDITAA